MRQKSAVRKQTRRDAVAETDIRAAVLLRWILLGVLLLLAALQAAAVGPLRPSFWGFHHSSFMPLTVQFLAWICAAAGILLVIRPTLASSMAGRVPLPWSLGPSQPRVAVLFLALVLGGVFWILRSGHTLLGDGLPLTLTLSQGERFHAHFPLTKLIQVQWYEWVHPIFTRPGSTDPRVVQDSIALLHVLCGVLFVFVAFGLGRILARATDASGREATAWLVTLLLIVQGYSQLFFGYVEHYTLTALCLGAYLLCALLYLQGRAPLFLCGGLFVLLIGLHLSSVVLGLSFLFLLTWGLLNPKLRWRAVRDTLAALGLVIALSLGISRLSGGDSLWTMIHKMAGVVSKDRGGGHVLEYMFSAGHLRDFFNEQVLIGPLAGLLLLICLIPWLRARGYRDVSSTFLLFTGAVYLVASWVTNEPTLGYARDWDIFAPAGVIYTAAGAGMFVICTRGCGLRNGILAGALLFSIAHVGPWVGLNHSEARSLERFAHLPLGFGRAQVVIGNWHLRQGNRDEARVWFAKALEEDPANNTAHSLTGVILAQEGRFNEAVVSFRRAVSLRPDKPEYREDLIRALSTLGAYAEALPHLAFLCERDPMDVDSWLNYSNVLDRGALPDSARSVLLQGVASFRRHLDAHPDDPDAHVSIGRLMLRLGDKEQALVFFQKALAVRPNSEPALFYASGLLAEMGQVDPARQLVERLLRLNPDHRRGQQLRARLDRNTR